MADKVLDKKWSYAILASLIVAVFFLRDYLMIIALAAVAAYMFYPTYRGFLAKFKRPAAAASLTTFAALMLLLVPVGLVVMMSISQTKVLITDVQSEAFVSRLESVAGSLQNITNNLSNNFGIEFDIDTSRDGLIESIKERGSEILSFIVKLLTGVASSVPRLFMYFILFIYLFTSMLVNGEKIISKVRAISPFAKQVTDTYLRKLSLMTSAMVKGQFLIAFLQGLVGAVSLWLIGFDYIFFFAVLLVFLSFIPLGGGIITLPIALVLLISGNIWQGLVVALTHILVVSNIDNLLRPKLVPKDAYLPAALVLLSTFAGISLFGLLGVIFGPLIMIVIVTTWDLYIEQKTS